MKILKEVLKEIKPSKEEEKEVNGIAKDVIKKINSKLKAEVILGGSGGKGTWLTKTKDIDVYVMFDYEKFKDKSAELSETLYPVLKQLFKKVDRLHGSRDYFQIFEKGYTIEIIPILNIKTVKDAKNITDISKLHVQWVKKNSNLKLRDEVRLLKKFLKAQRCYGAESYIKGFSGYVCEILTIKYKSFLGVLKACQKWKRKEVIDIEKYYKNSEKAIDAIDKSKQQSPIIIIDPVDKNRNAAAALSDAKLKLLKKRAKAFLGKPKTEYFKEKGITKEEIQKKYKNVILVEVVPLSGKDDVVGAKIMTCLDYIAKQSILRGFEIKTKGWEWNKETFYWIVPKKSKLSEEEKHLGPPIKVEKAVEAFKKKWKGKKILKQNGRVYVIKKREFTDLKEFIKHLSKDKVVKNKVKKLKVL